MVFQMKCFDLFLKVVQEVKPLTELYMPIQRMRETQTYLLQIQVS